LHDNARRDGDRKISNVTTQFIPANGSQSASIFQPDEADDPGSDNDAAKRIRYRVLHERSIAGTVQFQYRPHKRVWRGIVQKQERPDV
jgi:hypothetical protein